MTMRSFQVTVPAELAEAMDRQIGAGQFDSVDELVRDAIRAMVEPDASFDAWLSGDVAASCRDMADVPGSGVPVADVADRLRRRLATRMA